MSLTSYQNLKPNWKLYENTLELIYSGNSNLSTIAIDDNTELELSYTYFK